MNPSNLLLNTPAITNFESTDVGDSQYVIFKTTVEELVCKADNSPVIDAQIRGLTAALETLRKRKNEGQ